MRRSVRPWTGALAQRVHAGSGLQIVTTSREAPSGATPMGYRAGRRRFLRRRNRPSSARLGRSGPARGIAMTIDLNTANIRRTVSTIDTIARVVGRYGLVVVIAWIGALKFTAYEAQGIQPLVANSPFMSWLYDIFPVNTFSAMLGAVEITTAVLLAINPRFPRLSVLGSVLATGLFLATITFLFTT